jgi:hypothetical protein
VPHCSRLLNRLLLLAPQAAQLSSVLHLSARRLLHCLLLRLLQHAHLALQVLQLLKLAPQRLYRPPLLSQLVPQGW